ncbi:acyl-CoA synthetase, putative [Plasmodium vinckei vinckei]|uniref:Acyl-CoA synthetase, putative n=1 Tax=Plasmodium vinckei vinckei TaxID=54757 RepID=A0A449BRW1_PLAVN|nr:acyl-CoA synthetase, putative [Plasmodium vinckei vinckei]VEV56206.1 acyl-CoA synthetase, putative [Plasmodium vinckei vinckei]
MKLYSLLGIIIYALVPSKYKCQDKKEGAISYAKVHISSSNENESDVYKAIDKPDPGYKHALDYLLEKGQTNPNMTAVIENAHGKHVETYTYKTMIDKVNAFSSVLESYDGGVPEKSYDEKENDGKFKILGIYGNNSMNWLVADFAAMSSGITTLVMHSRFSVDEVIKILNESKLEWLCLDLKHAQTLLERIKDLPHLKKLIILDHIPMNDPKKQKELNKNNTEQKSLKGSRKTKKSSSTAEEIKHKEMLEKDKQNLYDTFMKVEQVAKKHNIEIHSMEYAMKKLAKNNTIKKSKNASPNFISTIIYTSGTSGQPKGVMLSNKNLYYAIKTPISSEMLDYFPTKTYLSYLPLSHVLERTVVYFGISKGVQIIVFSNDIKYFNDDLLGSETRAIVGVPKVFNRIYTSIQTEIANLPSAKRFFVNKALNIRRSHRHGKLDRFVESITGISKKIRNKINPMLKMALNGGGKLSPDVEKELSLLLDIDIYQGYGMTETAGSMFMQSPKDKSTNTVGGTHIKPTEYKVSTWETYDAKSKPPKGELLIKSDQLFRGYFLKGDLTKSSFTKDNYFKTGDVVQINQNGSITFLDRSKGLLKLSQGEYIETETLNNLYSMIPYINYCVAYADDTMDGAMAILSVDKNLFSQHLENDGILKKLNISRKEFMDKVLDEDVNKKKEYVDYIKKDMLEAYNKTNLSRYNLINDIYITMELWDTSNYLTPTFKVKRFKLIKDYDFYIQEVKSKYKDKLKGQKIPAKS